MTKRKWPEFPVGTELGALKILGVSYSKPVGNNRTLRVIDVECKCGVRCTKRFDALNRGSRNKYCSVGCPAKRNFDMCPRCLCCPGYRRGDRGVNARCSGCARAAFHGFQTHKEYDETIARGCWVCGEPAYGIDHDHEIGCHKCRGRSCEKCRRGPVCQPCNALLKKGATPKGMRDRAAKYQELAERNLLTADALEKWEVNK